jgi:penicillin-binding protein 1A
LRDLDKRQGWRPDAVRRVPPGQDPREWESVDWASGIVEGRVTDGVVIDVDPGHASVRVAGRTGVLTADAIRWTGERRPDRLLRTGDVIRVRPLGGAQGLRLALEQEPEAEAALIAIDPTSGEVLALVGGFDFSRSEYDRATQARRQTGSLFKPFVYAAAFDQGWTLADSLVDEPTVFLDPRKPVPYQPENFSRRYYETITLRSALERSINIATVKLLERIGYDPVIDTARRLGVDSPLRPYPSLALGAFELTLLEVTSAYGAFANQGLLFEPHWIKQASDRAGRTIHRVRPHVTEAVSPHVAYLMNRALSGVIRRGTGRSAGESLDRTLAGKTGTTDDNTDAWFVGYSPVLVVVVWVGYDERLSLWELETGGRAALPIWINFMRQALAGAPDVPFPIPPGIRTVPIDPRTGKRPSLDAGCEGYIVEAFIEGTEPGELCSREQHHRLLLPYPFQHYRQDVDGSLQIPRNELERLLLQEGEVASRFQWSSYLTAFLPASGCPTACARKDPAGSVPTDGEPASSGSATDHADPVLPFRDIVASVSRREGRPLDHSSLCQGFAGAVLPRITFTTSEATSFGTRKVMLYSAIFHPSPILRRTPVPRTVPYFSLRSFSSNQARVPSSEIATCRSVGM